MTGWPLTHALTSSTWIFFKQTWTTEYAGWRSVIITYMRMPATKSLSLCPKFQALWVLVYKKSWNLSEQTLDAGDLIVWGQVALLCSSCFDRPLLCKPHSLSTADYFTQKFEHKHCRATLTENTAYASHVRSFNNDIQASFTNVVNRPADYFCTFTLSKLTLSNQSK